MEGGVGKQEALEDLESVLRGTESHGQLLNGERVVCVKGLRALCLPLLKVTPWGITAQLQILFMEASAARVQSD